MKTAALFVLAVSALLGDGLPGAPGPDAPADTPKGVAVVELFTSEGCSSCPPADEVLAGFAKESRPVYALGFHIDYWNKLGHPDPFSSEANTQRQKQYVKALKAQSLYTPQMVVNGAAEFVGSDKARAAREVEKALAIPATVSVTVAASLHEATPEAAAGIEVTCTLRGVTKGEVAMAALVEDGLSTDVKKGENAGKTLKHAAVARVFSTISEPKEGENTVTLSPPAGLNAQNASVIVVVQDGETMRVAGAGKAKLKK